MTDEKSTSKRMTDGKATPEDMAVGKSSSKRMPRGRNRLHLKACVQVASLEWRNQLAYRGDVWLSSAFQVFRILLAWMLWSAVFGNNTLYGGMTLPEMVTYYLIGAMLVPLTQGEGLLWTFSEETRNGQYAKYLVRPMSPMGFFLSGSLARSVFPGISGFAALGLATLLFQDRFAAIRPENLLWMLALLVPATGFNLLLGYLISLASFRFFDVGGFYLMKTIIRDFLSGSLLPLNLLLPVWLIRWSPFGYSFYYPAMICLGKAEQPPLQAIGILWLWVVALWLLCRTLERQARRLFEGVGL